MLHSATGKTKETIAARFAEVASERGDDQAIKCGEEAITYRELDSAANRVARVLVETGGDANEPVAALFEDGMGVQAAMMGTLAAGKIFVPFDATFPHERLSYMLADTEGRIILTDTAHLSLAGELGGGATHVVNLDDLDGRVEDGPLGISIPLDSLCCMLYTSGSTGEPKGVTYTQELLKYRAMNYWSYMHIEPGDRLSTMGSFAFAGSVALVLAALVGGLRVYTGRRDTVERLADLLRRDEITVGGATPSVLRHFLDGLTGKERFPKLRFLCVGGEPLHRAEAERFVEIFPHAAIINVLAMTEAGVITAYVVDKNTRFDGDLVPVGVEVGGGVEILLLNGDGRPAPPGEPGRIAVRSGHLSPGYWRKPDETAAVFLPDPDGGDRRIYLTGDLGRRLPDGNLVHLGREDFQAKIRAYRIEPAEIELVLRSHESISEAVVVTAKDASGENRLVAYVVPSGGVAPTVSALRRIVTAKLPEYMAPSAFVVLERMPLNPNGKVDRHALPEPGSARPVLDTAFVAPRTPVEKKLAEIWTAVLRLDKVGVDDDFLELGGHSLLATQVASRIIDAFGVELTLQEFLAAPTTAQCALVVSERLAEQTGIEDVETMLSELENQPQRPPEDAFRKDGSQGAAM